MQYAPLDPSKTEIRLVELLPRATNSSPYDERALRCNVFHISLNDKPDYAALSYAWGDPQDTQIIMVGHTSVPVTRNLYSALEHLRYEKTARFIWIDALCINQSDTEEKFRQVQLMREIYQRATFVAIWLGPADSTSDKVMDFLRVFGAKAMGFGLDGGPDMVRNVPTQWRKLACDPPSFRDRSKQRVTFKSLNSTAADQEFLMGDLNELYYSISGFHEQDHLFPVEGITNLFTRPWWSRTWVLQEVSLAQKAGFVCGTKRLSRRCCTAALNALIVLRPILQGRVILKGATSTVYQLSVSMADFDGRPAILLCMWLTLRCDPFPLLALLRATCSAGRSAISPRLHHLEATDPRDKIYGILGLAADRDELKEFGIQPDYTKSCRDLYTSVAALILRQGHLSVLSLNQFPKAQAGLPTWVPDWSQPLNSPLQAYAPDHMTLEPEYKASSSLIQRTPLFNSVGVKMSVLVSGFVYDEVNEFGATWAKFRPLVDMNHVEFVPAQRILAELIRLSFLRGNLYKNAKQRISAAARTVTAEVGFSDNGNWERIGSQRYHIAVSLLTIPVNDINETKFLTAIFLELMRGGELQLAIDPVVAAKYMGEIEAKARDRKPFVTAKGHLGLGPDHAEAGDVIAVLIGCQVPFILRKSVDGKYEIVGEAYVDGIMDGEAVVGKQNIGTVELC